MFLTSLHSRWGVVSTLLWGYLEQLGELTYDIACFLELMREMLELIACLARALKGLANNCSEGEYYMRLEVKSFEMVRPTVW